MGFNPVDLAFGNMEALYASNERLKAENAKLRDLVMDMWHELDSVTQYAGDSREAVFKFKYAMRELGIEVINV